MIGTTWPYQVGALKAEDPPIPVEAVLPTEGATGWADTWMLAKDAAHPNCMLMWMAYATTPAVQAKTAYTFGSAPANPKACTILDKLQPNYCTDYHVTDQNYFKQHLVLENAADRLRRRPRNSAWTTRSGPRPGRRSSGDRRQDGPPELPRSPARTAACAGGCPRSSTGAGR